jgi:hypothetical protein
VTGDKVYVGRRCPECAEPVPDKVRVCPNCKSFQDWRRYAGIGQLTLALLIAVISVVTTFSTSVIPLLRPMSSDIRMILEKVEDAPKEKINFSFLARNAGRSGALVAVTGVSVSDRKSTYDAQLDGRSVYVAPDHEERISAVGGGSGTVDQLCKKVTIGRLAAQLDCQFVVTVTGFGRDEKKTLVVTSGT